MDCFVAEPVIGPAQEGRTRWLLAMTVGGSLRDQRIHMLDRVQKILLEFLHHGAGRFDAVDQPDALADKVAHEVARPGVAGGGRAACVPERSNRR